MSGLWSKTQPTEAASNAAQQAATLDRLRKGLVPGTWLQLSPNAERPQEKWLTLSPKAETLQSPAATTANASPVADDLSLDNYRFLSNNVSASRSSSVSSTKSISTKPSVFKPVSPTCEREVIGLARFRAD